MKHLLIISTIVLVCFYTGAQNSAIYNSTFYYVGSPSNTLNYVECMINVANRIYLVLTNVDHQGQYNTVIEIDSSGNKLNQVSLFVAGASMVIYPGNSVLVDKHGDIIVVSSAMPTTPGPTDGYIAKLTPSLDTQWTRTYSIPPVLAGYQPDTSVWNNFTAIRQTPDGGYIIAGNYRLNSQPGTISDRACLLKVDTAGEVEWWRVYPNQKRIFDIETAPDSGYLFLDSKASGFDVVKLDKNGVIQWIVPLNSSYVHLTGQDLELINDSVLAIAGQYVYDDTPAIPLCGIDFYLFNLNNQQMIMNKEFRLFKNILCATIHQNFKLQPLNDGFIIAATATVVAPDSSETEHKGVLFKLDNNGDSVWVKYYQYGDFGDQCQFNDVLVMEDGGFLAVGYHFPGTVNAGAWLVRTDSNGYAPGAYPTGIFKPEPMVSELKLYPNPTSGISWLELDVKHLPHSSLPGRQAGSTLKLFNINGKLVQTTTLPPGTQVQEINTQNLPSGLYLVNLVFEDGKVFSGKLVVE